MLLESVACFFRRLAFPSPAHDDALDPLMQRVAKSAGLELPEKCNRGHLDAEIERVAASTHTPLPGSLALP